MNKYMVRFITGALPHVATIKAPTAEDALVMAQKGLDNTFSQNLEILGIRACEPDEDVSRYDTIDLYYVFA